MTFGYVLKHDYKYIEKSELKNLLLATNMYF